MRRVIQGVFDPIKEAMMDQNMKKKEQDRNESNVQASAEREQEASYIDALKAQRAEKDAYFRQNPYSPLEPEDRQTFSGLKYYEPDLAFQYILQLQPADPERITLQTNTGDEQTYNRIGTVTFEVDGEPAEAAIYQSTDDDDLFLPFRDATSAKETYGAGRYLEPVDLGNEEVLVDFNLAYNPYCAYSPNYSCPLPPVENWLKVPIRAGEKKFKEH
jgi:uncharacterized protein (DUF1684 family)